MSIAHETEDTQTAREPQSVITVRMPKSLHERLRECAHACRMSMNRFCIEALSQHVQNTERGLLP